MRYDFLQRRKKETLIFKFCFKICLNGTNKCESIKCTLKMTERPNFLKHKPVLPAKVIDKQK